MAVASGEVDVAVAVGVEKMTDSPGLEITSELATAADREWEGDHGVSFVALNALIISVFVYFFHGLSIILFLLNKYSVPTLIRVGVYLLIIVHFLLILAAVGFFDQWIDLRKLHRHGGGDR